MAPKSGAATPVRAVEFVVQTLIPGQIDGTVLLPVAAWICEHGGYAFERLVVEDAGGVVANKVTSETEWNQRVG